MKAVGKCWADEESGDGHHSDRAQLQKHVKEARAQFACAEVAVIAQELRISII